MISKAPNKKQLSTVYLNGIEMSEEQDFIWNIFDTMIPEEHWVPTEFENYIIDTIAKVLKGEL